MPEEIASDAALSFSPEAVHLQCRIGDEWRETDHVRFDGADMRAGLSRMHGLRHAYAQRRYEELTGWPSPAAGGPASKTLSHEQRSLEQNARLTISRELGHERISIVRIYVG